MRLSRATLGAIPEAIRAPRRRAAPGIGVVHFGPGAFHRAHQASYIDDLLDHDPRWGIAGVSLRTAATAEALAAQDGLYALAVRDARSALRVIGAHQRFLGPQQAAETAALLADPGVRLVTTTVTEKGYCLAADGTLDVDHPDIVHDLRAAHPRSVIGWITAGLATRREAGTAPFIPMPCDNLAANGAKLKAALVAFAGQRDAQLADWIDKKVLVPSTMVDSITPASDARLLADVATALGVEDAASVQRESFVQWVIEDRGDTTLAPLGQVGAILTDDVAAYERAKLRILNGAHSTLAYLGLLRGHATVFEAISDPALSAFVERMIAEDILPTIDPVPGMDLPGYAADVLARFRNPVIEHRLEQIAQDGSQKIPYRLGDTLIEALRRQRTPRHVIRAIAGWLAFVIERVRDDTGVIDPAATALAGIVEAGEVTEVADRILSYINLDLSDHYNTHRDLTGAVRPILDRQWDDILR